MNIAFHEEIMDNHSFFKQEIKEDLIYKGQTGGACTHNPLYIYEELRT